MLQTLADPEAAHKVKVRNYQLESISKSLKCSAIRYLSKSVRNFELRRRKECKEFDAEAASKLRLPKQHLPTDRDRGARYRGMKEKSRHPKQN